MKPGIKINLCLFTVGWGSDSKQQIKENLNKKAFNLKISSLIVFHCLF